MNSLSSRALRWRLLGFGIALLLPYGHARADDTDFVKPTKDELAMTALPGYPGAAAVILNRAEVDDGDQHFFRRYERIKILTEEGKDLANVELRFVSAMGDGWVTAEQKDVDDIVGRTIHPDGTIVPFSGRAYLKEIEKANGYKYQARVFSLPDAGVGDIIEYRYTIRISPDWYQAPDWIIQGDFFIKSAKYTWRPTRRELMSRDGAPINSITWFPVLPPGAKVEETEVGGSRYEAGWGPQMTFQLSLHDVPPFPQEDHQPPIDSFTYRVLFNFSEYRTPRDYWNSVGTEWSKQIDKFIDVNALRGVAMELTRGISAEGDKARNIYAAVEQLENTDYTRARSAQENASSGLRTARNAESIYRSGRGTSSELTELFVGLCRSAGLKAYVMGVPSRAHTVFVPQWMEINQLEDLIAIVKLDGKEVFFDPGERFTPFGHLAWEHTFTSGVRQVDNGVEIAPSDTEAFADNRTIRAANLLIDDAGRLDGEIDLSFTGDAAAKWREEALSGDEESVRRSLRRYLEEILPQSVQVELESIDNLAAYDDPLEAHFLAKGAAATVTSKRLLLPADLFTVRDAGMFAGEKRSQPVYFHYPEIVQDVVHIKLPPTLQMEAMPEAGKTPYESQALYTFAISANKSSFTVRRNLIRGTITVPAEDYPHLRGFYATFEAKDHDPIVLAVSPDGKNIAAAPPKQDGAK